VTPTPRRGALESRFIDLGGPVHFADFGGDGPTMVLVHGLGGSAVNWMAVGPGLATRARVGLAWADTASLQAARSLIATLVMRPRRYLRLIAEVDVPTLLIQGAADRLVPLASIEALVRNRPEWTVHVLDGIGHVPQLEAPAASSSW
jgi:pimeloyl-ACP methyl ester carboxylesterase